jgi:hypothetical protein
MRLSALALLLIPVRFDTNVLAHQHSSALTYNAFRKAMRKELKFVDYDDRKGRYDFEWLGGGWSDVHVCVDERDRLISLFFFYNHPLEGPPTADDLGHMRKLLAILCPDWIERNEALQQLLEVLDSNQVGAPARFAANTFDRETKNGGVNLYPDYGSSNIETVCFSIYIPLGVKANSSPTGKAN